MRKSFARAATLLVSILTPGFLMASLLAALPTPARAALAHPQLTTLTRESPATVAPGGKVEFRYATTPGTAGIESVLFVLFFRTAENANFDYRTVRVTAAQGIASFDIDSTWVNGRYELSFVRITDRWNRRVEYAADGTVSGSHSATPRAAYYADATTHSWGFANLGVTVSGASPLPSVPTLTSITAATAGTLAPGQIARFRIEGSSGRFPLARIRFVFTSTTNSSSTLAATAETSTLTGEITLPIANSMGNGRYRLTSVQLTDAQGFGFNYTNNNFVFAGIDGVSYIATDHLVDLTTKEFTITGASASANSPRIVSWTREGQGEVVPGTTLRFAYDIATVDFPLERATTRLVGPFGATREITLPAANGVLSIPVTADWVSGPYFFNLLTLTDALGRTVTYVPSGERPLAAINVSGLPIPADGFRFDVRGLTIPPYFLQQPAAETRVIAGRSVTLSAPGAGASAVTYQWFRGEPGDTRAPLASDQGFPHQITFFPEASATYWVRLTSGTATIDSQAARVAVFPPSATGRLINLSVLTNLDSPTDQLTLGYVVGGDGTSGPKPLVLRAAGPSLGALGVPGTITDPTMEFFAGAIRTGGNDNWGGSTDVAAAMATVGAFPYTGPTSRDSAVVANTTTRDNSVRVTGVGGATGAVIAEVYDATSAGSFTSATPRLLNVSVRKHLGTGLTAGFVVGGSTNVRVLIRVIGPGLAQFGVPGTVADPQLALFRGTTQIGANNDWALDIATAGNSVGAFALTSGSRDAALVATLEPGNYSVRATGVNNTTGVALVEVFELP